MNSGAELWASKACCVCEALAGVCGSGYIIECDVTALQHTYVCTYVDVTGVHVSVCVCVCVCISVCLRVLVLVCVCVCVCHLPVM